MDDKEITNNIRRLSGFIEDAYLKTTDDKFFTFQSDFLVFHQQIKQLFTKWFPKAKNYSDEEIVNQVFRSEVSEKDTKNWIKYSFSCLLNSSQRVYDNILYAKNMDDQQLFLCEMNLLKEMSFEAAILMEIAFDLIEKRTVNFGYGKRFYIRPKETFDASKQILRKYTKRHTFGDWVLSPSSIFLIRQSIELWLQSIFAINFATDDKNDLIKLQPERLFGLLDNRGVKVNLPVSKAVILKIHQWTQSYVHAGWIAYSWEIEHSHNVLQPIFNPSNIVIKKEHFDTVEDQVRTIFKNSKIKLHRLKNSSSTIK